MSVTWTRVGKFPPAPGLGGHSGGVFTAVVVTAPAEGSRDLVIRPEAGTATCPATLPAGVVLTVGVGSRVYAEMSGRAVIVRGGV